MSDEQRNYLAFGVPMLAALSFAALGFASLGGVVLMLPAIVAVSVVAGLRLASALAWNRPAAWQLVPIVAFASLALILAVTARASHVEGAMLGLAMVQRGLILAGLGFAFGVWAGGKGT